MQKIDKSPTPTPKYGYLRLSAYSYKETAHAPVKYFKWKEKTHITMQYN
jgi:hypothetical protein